MRCPLKLFVVSTLAISTAIAGAQNDLQVPSTIEAGTAVSLSGGGGGEGTLYVAGPGGASKRKVNLSADISISGDELRIAGRYVVVLCSQSCRSAAFFVTPAKVHTLGFLVHPSRVPAGQPEAISGVAFPVDKFQNLVTAPVEVTFRLNLGESPLMSRAVTSEGGIAWFRTNAGTRSGLVHVNASAEGVSVRRAVQEVGSEPCRLSITAQRNTKWISVQTAPLRDCAGNPVQDGTIVTFTANTKEGKSTIDAPVKQGIAKAQITADGPAVISAASGVVMGNELKVGAQ
jgi:hypothetical protein